MPGIRATTKATKTCVSDKVIVSKLLLVESIVPQCSVKMPPWGIICYNMQHYREMRDEGGRLKAKAIRDWY
jgi:hypothetical protein